MDRRLCIFDIGDVLLMRVKSLREMAEELGIDVREFREDFQRCNDGLMEGRISDDDYYRHLYERFSVRADRGIFLNNYHPYINRPLIDMIKGLKNRGATVVYGSNTFEPYVSWLKENAAELYALPDRSFFSNEIHLSKPKASFFRHILSSMSFDSSSACFVDDRKENIDGAEGVGIRSFLYDGNDDDLRSFLFCP